MSLMAVAPEQLCRAESVKAYRQQSLLRPPDRWKECRWAGFEPEHVGGSTRCDCRRFCGTCTYEVQRAAQHNKTWIEGVCEGR